jgi:hypothetical protein
MRNYGHIPDKMTYAVFMSAVDDELVRCTEVDEVSGAQCYRRMGHHIIPCQEQHSNGAGRCMKELHVGIYKRTIGGTNLPTQTKWFSEKVEGQS